VAGRIRRASQATPGQDGQDGKPGDAAAAAPGAGLESTLALIWADVLGTDPPGPHDDFFEMGGNSLVAVSLIEKIRKAVGVRLPMRVLFQEPTVAGMTAQARRLLDDGPAAGATAYADETDEIPVIRRPSH
jgi:acyl carrier protein